ncbi:hypothetical protein [Leptospira interrogans]|nr:hypothetical protein [Leptospira interrogans]
MCLLILKSYSICGLVMALYGSRLKLSKTLSYGSRLNSAKRFPMGRV